MPTRRTLLARVLFSWALMGATLTPWSGGPAAAPPSPLVLKSRTLFNAGETSPREHAFYVRRGGAEMMTSYARSPDNGRTWTPARPSPDFDSGLRKGFRRSTYSGFVDPVTDRMITLVLSLDVPDLDPNIEEPPVGENEYYLRYRVSADGGRTFLFDERIRQTGDYDDRRPIDGVWLGKNGYYLGDAGCVPIRTREGKILVPVQVPLLGPDGALSLPGGGFTYQYTRILIGVWTDEHKLRWEVSDKILGDPDRTSRGLFEPTLAELPDGRILCVMRGSNGGKRDPDCRWPAYKWRSISQDGGRTWSPAEPWKYSDGGEFHSPSAMSQLLRHSSGRIFWLGNLSRQNCCANNPRYPLVIGEVDPQDLGLVKSTLLTLDTLQADDTQGLNLSHWLAYEDRQTGDIVVPMRRWTADYKMFRGVEYVVGIQR
ncbi:MAG: exo-alpha-sialidase [Pirellulales bacterium]|nr:exo-alpha-sialidase [Pirellulales bacterium]